MSSERIRQLLTQLRKELDVADIDAETRTLMSELDADIRKTLDAHPNPVDALIDRAEAVGVNFALRHGVADRILREIIETLAKIGV